jgi:PAS domain S-box-containing protein
MSDEVSDGALVRIAELETELKNARAQFCLAEQAARVGYWRMTLPDYRVTWSSGMNSIFGLDPTDQTSADENAYPLRDTDHVRLLLKKIKMAFATRSRLSERTHIRRADGVERIVDVVGDIEFGPDGKPIAMVGATHDVTEQVAVEAERRRIEELHHILTEATSDIMMVRDVLGKVEFASAALDRVLGWASRDFEADSVIRLIHPDDLPKAMEMRRKASRGEFTTATYRMRHVDGRYIWIETKMSLSCDETGNTRYIVTIMRDVSERKAQELALVAAREAAEAANRAKSAFLANMSHELRTPLNAVIGFADMMTHEVLGPIGNPRYREYVSNIQKSGQHLLDLINDLLDMSKIEAGKFELYIEEFDLAKTVEECIKIVADRAARGGVGLNLAVPAEGVKCALDRRAVRQILLNLLSNAIKFTPAGGRIDVATRPDGELVQIEVRDNGIGVAAEDLPRLTIPFEQVCGNPMLARAGTGLGLTLVRALVEQHGGRLRIESPDQKGTIVTVEFPRIAAERAVAA